MTKKKYDYAVFIGRFQPYHIGHHHVTQEALKLAENVIFVIGSHDKPRDFRNPYTTKERISIIRSALSEDEKSRVHFAPQVDYPYNEERWIASVQSSVSTVAYKEFRPGPYSVCIIGFNKDHSSYYLKKFPQWELIEISPKYDIDATSIRVNTFNYGDNMNFDTKILGSVNSNHSEQILNFSAAIYDQMNSEYEYIENYKKQWGSGPFVTVDSVVTQAGHILLIERGREYGEGQLALPGGFINPHETLREAALRELREETKLKVPVPVLVGSIVREHTYDHPYRSNRARLITHAYHFRLNDMAEGLPKVKGSDDANRAFWMPLSEFSQSRSKMFEDHYSIVQHMIGV